LVIGLQGYTKSPDGFGTGSYSPLHPRGVRYQLSRSLFEGDTLSITSTRKSLDPELHKARAIRLYDGATKVFDGYLRAPNYNRKPNLLRDLTAKAYNWDKELESVYITESGNYTSKTIDYILADLCRIANEGGVVKKAEYKYDTSKIPYYSSDALNTAISPTFKGTVGSALKDLTRSLDVLEIDRMGDWIIKVDSLQSDSYIYLIPQMVSVDSVAFGTYEVGVGFTNLLTHPYGLMLWAQTLTDISSSNLTLTITYTDQGGANPNTATVIIPNSTLKDTYFPISLAQGDTLVKDVTNITGSGGGSGNAVRILGKGSRTLPDWKLQPPKNLGLDYSKLLNFVEVKGQGGLVSAILGATPLLAATNITSNSFTANATLQPTKRNYLKITIANTSASDKTGNIVINGGDGASPPNELTERFFFRVPAGQTRWHMTNNRYATLSTGALHSFEVNSFSATPNCTIMVEECMYGVAGRSINDFGIRADTFPNDDFDTQLKCDSYALQMVNKYHAPLVYCSAVLKPGFIDTADYTGKTIRLYDDIEAVDTDFICLRQDFAWVGEQITETIEVMRYNFDWEYTE
jgi:hypothetical protein